MEDERIGDDVLSDIEIREWAMIGYDNPTQVKKLKSQGFDSLNINTYISTTLKEIYNHDSEKISYFLIDDGKEICLDLLMVVDKYHNQSHGKIFMQRLCELADYTYKDITLTPSSEFGSDLDRLVRFYARFGFVELEDGTFIRYCITDW